MELQHAIRSRRSTAAITDASPDAAELARLLAVAAHSPDHAGLRPWRFVALRGSDRDRLGAALVAGFGDEPGSPGAAKTARKAYQAPLLLAVIAVPVDHPKVPEWEQIAAIGALVATLQLLLHEAGYTAMWRTGPPARLPDVQALHGVAESERLLGWLYMGGTAEPATADAADPADPDVTGRISALPPG